MSDNVGPLNMFLLADGWPGDLHVCMCSSEAIRDNITSITFHLLPFTPKGYTFFVHAYLNIIIQSPIHINDMRK